jgi:hypothetical protein
MTSAFQYIRSSAAPSIVPRTDTRDLVRLLGLDCLTIARPRLVCRWYRDADGRLSCAWEPDIVPAPRR